jgi:hypothetical protein
MSCSIALGVSRLKPQKGTNIDDDMGSDIPGQQLTYASSDNVSLIDCTLEQRLEVMRRKADVAQSKKPAPEVRAKQKMPSPPPQHRSQSAKPASSQLPTQMNSQMTTQHREDYKTRSALDFAVCLNISHCSSDVH